MVTLFLMHTLTAQVRSYFEQRQELSVVILVVPILTAKYLYKSPAMNYKPETHFRACLHGGRVPQLTELPWESQLFIHFFRKLVKRLHARQGNPPCQGTLSTCPGHPSRRAIFCHVNGSSRPDEVQGPRYISRQLLTLTASGDHSISRVQNNSPRH